MKPLIQLQPATPWLRRVNSGWTYTDRITSSRNAGNALDFYVEFYPHSDREQWRERFEQGQISLDSVRCEATTQLHPGSTLSYHRPGWEEPAAPRSFRQLYADDDLVAVEKPSGLQVLPAAQFLQNTLLDVVREELGEDLSPVHRLGRGTSGIVLFARSELARRELSRALSDGSMRKTYVTLVQGVGLAEHFTLRQPIGRIEYGRPAGASSATGSDRTRLNHVFAATDDGKPSCSHVRVLEVRPDIDATLVEVDIPTGRPHQIRIHLAAAGHPLIGEPLYVVGGRPAAPAIDRRVPLPGDLGYHLHACRVEFDHPATSVPTAISSEPPALLRVSADADS